MTDLSELEAKLDAQILAAVEPLRAKIAQLEAELESLKQLNATPSTNIEPHQLSNLSCQQAGEDLDRMWRHAISVVT